MTSDGYGTGADPDLVRRLFEAQPDGLWLFDDEGVTTWANAHMARILGRDLAEMRGMRATEVMDEQGRRDFSFHLAEMVRGGAGRENVDAYFVRRDGTAVWGLVSFAPVHDDDGHRIGWLHRVAPYTERKELVETLLEREHQLATAQQIAHIGSWSWDVGTDRIEWSDEMCRIFGVEPGTAMTYATYVGLLHPDDRELADRTVQDAAVVGGEYSFDHRLVRADGELRWVRGRGVVEIGRDGAVLRMSGTAQDITDRRNADEQAAEATRRLFLLQKLAMAANVATSLREALMMAGAGVTELTSWHALGAYLYEGDTELLDLTAGDHPVHPDHDLAERARASGTITVGTPSAMADTHSIVAMPVHVGEEVVAVVEMLADEVPPDENSHQLMSQIAHQLGVVAERERSAMQLAEARDQAMEASRLKSEFLATMSHEIRTPMNGVIGLTDLLLRTGLDDHQRRLADNLQGAGLTLLGIINDILDLSKIESGKLELETADFDVRSVFDQVASVLAGPAHDKGLELVVACHPDVPTLLRGDSVRLGQILSNLGSNAVKFTDRGEVAIQAQVASETPRDVLLSVDVSDTGVGIAPDARERLFDAFTQADPSTTRRHGGTGLGLAISRQLVEALGGEIRVSSEPGEGSTFSFTVRLGRSPGGAARPERARHLTGRRVLVVDDNATNRLILDEQLSAWGMQVVGVAAAEEALIALAAAAAEVRPFELAILDLVMPGIDGIELARRIRADPALGRVALMLLTSDEQVTLQEIKDAGIGSSLAKPVRHSELRNALLALLGGPADAPPPASPAGPSLGIRVLVVEDNLVNQLVATGLLESIGCAVDLAADGAEAVELLTRPHGYAAVLMDCRMPRLDGFDATREVRAHEDVGRHVPIIAMTASALEGERERCLAAGMDDYLTKPVDPLELERAVRRWAVPVSATAAPSAAPPPPRPMDDDVLDSARVEMLDGVVKDGLSLFHRAATSFMGRVGDQLVAIRDAVTRDHATSLLNSAHQLKGSALNVGLPRVAQAAQRLESLGIDGHTTGAGLMLTELTREVEMAMSALQQATTGDR